MLFDTACPSHFVAIAIDIFDSSCIVEYPISGASLANTDYLKTSIGFNSLRPSDAYMRQ